MTRHSHRGLVIAGLFAFLLINILSMTACGQKRIHVATTSGGPDSSGKLAANGTQKHVSDSHGLSGSDLQTSSLEEESSRHEETSGHEPLLLTHEPVSLPSETPFKDAAAGTPGQEMAYVDPASSRQGLDHTDMVKPGREILTQSPSSGSAEPYPSVEPSQVDSSSHVKDTEGTSLSDGEDAGAGSSDEPEGDPFASVNLDPDREGVSNDDQRRNNQQSPHAFGSTFRSSQSDAHSPEPSDAHSPEPLALDAHADSDTLVPPEKVPGETTIAKVEPSDAIRHQLDQLKEEESHALLDVFFEFDSWALTPEGRTALEHNAEWLKTQPSAKLLIQGHCDQRGTQAYNLVLGEKRAMVIRDYLVELGIDPDRLSIMSYGKEKPFCTDPTEVCYQLNRRGHFVVHHP